MGPLILFGKSLISDDGNYVIGLLHHYGIGFIAYTRESILYSASILF